MFNPCGVYFMERVLEDALREVLGVQIAWGLQAVVRTWDFMLTEVGSPWRFSQRVPQSELCFLKAL